MTGNNEIPDDRCGVELVRPRVFILEADYKPMGDICCWRETWRDTARCVWHVEIENKPIKELKSSRADGPERLDGAYLVGVKAGNELSFSGCILRSAIFSEGEFSRTQFYNTDLTRAEFHNTDLDRVEFHDATLRRAEFHDADLHDADCTDAVARRTDFIHAILHDAVLTRADCRGATFTSALLYETVFADTRINSQTTFHDPDATFYDSITFRPAVVYEENPLTAEDLPEGTHPLEAAEWVYRRLEKLHNENALSEEARDFHISKEEARRAYQDEQRSDAREELYEKLGERDMNYVFDALKTVLHREAHFYASTLQWRLTQHGESLTRILTHSAALILVCGVVYPFVGGFESSSTGTVYRLHLFSVELSLAAIGDTISTILQSIYFSVITFTTIGYGDLYPTGAGSKMLVGFESLSGAILIALFVFVLGRRVAR